MFLLQGCRNEVEIIKSSEKKHIKLGVSAQQYSTSKFLQYINKQKKISSNNNSTIYTEAFSKKINFDSAYFSSSTTSEVFYAPIKTFGNYKREILSIHKNNKQIIYLLTYPSKDDLKHFYITNLDNRLIKEVKIANNGQEISNNNERIVTRTSDETCSERIYHICNSLKHSFEWGNAWECEFWQNLNSGIPPAVFTIYIPCGTDGSSGGGNNGLGNTPPIGGSGGTTIPPIGSAGIPTDLSTMECIQNLDCENCNLPGDVNNDCSISSLEMIYKNFFENLLPEQQRFLNNNASINNLFYQYLNSKNFDQNSLYFAYWGIVFFTQYSDTTKEQFQSWFIEGNQDFNKDLLKMILENNYKIPSYTISDYPGKNNGMPFNWWNDETYLNTNISMGFNSVDLTLEEIKMCALFPAAALTISTNKNLALDTAANSFPGQHLLNDKADAFRHAFFNALNIRDVYSQPSTLGMFTFAKDIVRMFGIAHESEVPANLNLEKVMDLYNNEQGIEVCSTCNPLTNPTNLVKGYVMSLLENGKLVYLKPIDYSGYTTDPTFWDNPNTPIPSDGHHGITSLTKIVPSNQ